MHKYLVFPSGGLTGGGGSEGLDFHPDTDLYTFNVLK